MTTSVAATTKQPQATMPQRPRSRLAYMREHQLHLVAVGEIIVSHRRGDGTPVFAERDAEPVTELVELLRTGQRAEFLLGNLPITWLHAVFFLAPLYGAGALLIREAASATVDTIGNAVFATAAIILLLLAGRAVQLQKGV